MELVEEHYSPDITEAAPRSFKRNIKELMQWLQELEEQANTLKKVEKEFLETRDDELLKPFQPNIRLNFVTLKVPIEEPHYLCNIPQCITNASNPKEEQFYKMIMDNIIEDAKLFNPKAEIKIVEKTDGKQSMAVIGVDSEVFDAFHALRNQERKVNREIKNTEQTLDEKLAIYLNKESEYIPPIPHKYMDSISHGKSK